MNENNCWALILLPRIKLKLSKGYVATINECDWPSVGMFKWSACERQNTNTVYAVRGMKVWEGGPGAWKKTLLLHQQILGFPKCPIDHINGDGLLNTRSNIRVATVSQNQQNRVPKKSVIKVSKYKGVKFHKKNKKWWAMIGFGGKQIYLGTFSDEIDAARAYNSKAHELFGVFARPNSLA